MTAIIAEQRKIVKGQYLYLWFAALAADNGGVAIAVEVFHQIGGDAYAIAEQDIIYIQSAVEGDKLILRALKAVHFSIKAVYHPKQFAATHYVLIQLQFLFIGKFLYRLFNDHGAKNGRDGRKTVYI